MLRLFQNYSPFTVLLLIIAAFVMKFQVLSHPQLPVALPDHILFASILKFLNPVFRGAFGYTLFAVFILFTQALYLNYITVKYRLFNRNTYLPAFTYLLLTSIYPAFNYFSEPLLINWLLLISLSLMLSFSQTTQPRKQIFNAGFAICLPVLFQFPTIGFIILLVLALLLLRSFSLGEWIVAGMGYLTPIYFFVCILFLVDQLPAVTRMPEIGFSIPRHLANPVYLTGTLIGLLFLLIMGTYTIQQQIHRLTIFIKRSWILIYMYFVVSLVVNLIVVSAVNAEWLILVPSMSFVIINGFLLEKSKRFSNFTFYFSLLLLIFCQLALK